MFSPLPTDAVTHGIQLAVAPVFLLTAVSGMIGAVAGRAQTSVDEELLERARTELSELRNRGRLANGCIALLTLCAFLIGLTIIVLFLGETTAFEASRLAVGGFLGGVVSFLLALLCFMAETIIATRLLNFQLPQRS